MIKHFRISPNKIYAILNGVNNELIREKHLIPKKESNL
jgi:hypothetical protein